MSGSLVFRRPDGRPVGYLAGDWLVKKVCRDRHMLRRPEAWCVDRSHLDELCRVSARGVKLVDEAGTTWTASLADFARFGVAIDRGCGRQIALPLHRWRARGLDGEGEQAEQPALPGFGMAVSR